MRRATPAVALRNASQAGLSLVELMVGLVVGLIVALAITASVSAIGKQVRITGAGSGAADSAQVALGILDRDIRMAGADLFSSGAAGVCPRINLYRAGTTVFDAAPFAAALAPVRIVDGGASGADAIELLLGDPSPGLRAVAVVKAMPGAAAVFKVTEPRNVLAVDDLVLVAHPPPNDTEPCTLIQVTGITGACNDGASGCNVNYNSGRSDYNPPNPAQVFSDPQTYGEGSLLIGVNSLLTITRYTVRCGALLRHDAAIEPACTGTPSYRDSALAGDVVMLKAQYGIAPANSDAIGEWKGEPITDYERGRVKAIRTAVVTRSREPDNAVVTPAAPTVFGGALALDLSATSLPAGRTWQNYRYRVQETVTPLRNVAWNR